MNLKEQVILDWQQLEKGQKRIWPFRIILFFFIVLYLFFLWRMLGAVHFFISLFTLHLETALLFYWIKKFVLMFYYLLFWFFIHFVIFFVIRPLLLMRNCSELPENSKRVSLAFVVVFLSILFSLNPFFLPFSFFMVAIMTYYISFPQVFSLLKFNEQWKVWIIEGGKLFLLYTIPLLNILLLPRLFAKDPQ